MCLYTKWRFPRITLWPKHCYKIITIDEFGRMLTPYEHYPVTFNKVLRDKKHLSKFINVDPAGYSVEGGMFHTFSLLDDAKEEAICLRKSLLYDDKELLVIIHATIPMFTRYYSGTFGERKVFCSKRIKYSKKNVTCLEEK